jgi:cytochrome bd-type quinol oxidase subunit 1
MKDFISANFLDLAFRIAGGAVSVVVLAILLWVVLRFQKLKPPLWKILFSAALTTGLGMIPFAGIALGYVALLVCIWKLCDADLFPDTFFTASITNALVFCFNLFLIGAAMGDLKMRFAGEHDPEFAAMAETVLAEAEAEASAGPTGTAAPKPTAPRPPPPGLKLLGLTVNGTNRVALLRSGTMGRTVAAGESFEYRDEGRTHHLRCAEIRADAVLVEWQGAMVELRYGKAN